MRLVRAIALILISAFAGCATSAPGLAQSVSDPALAEAYEVLRLTPIIDGHNDFPSQVLARGGSLDLVDLARPQPRLHTDLARLQEGRVGAQFWSAYVTPDSMGGGALRHGLRDVAHAHAAQERECRARAHARNLDELAESLAFAGGAEPEQLGQAVAFDTMV